MSTENISFWRAVVIKTAFHPVPLRRVQAAMLYRSLENVEWTADELSKELVGDDTHIAGIAVGALAGIQLIERCGRKASPSPTRNAAWVNVWRINPHKRSTALVWLERNGFPKPEQDQMALAI